MKICQKHDVTYSGKYNEQCPACYIDERYEEMREKVIKAERELEELKAQQQKPDPTSPEPPEPKTRKIVVEIPTDYYKDHLPRLGCSLQEEGFKQLGDAIANAKESSDE